MHCFHGQGTVECPVPVPNSDEWKVCWQEEDPAVKASQDYDVIILLCQHRGEKPKEEVMLS